MNTNHNTKTARERLTELWALTTDWTDDEEAEYERLAPIVRSQNEKRKS